MAGPFDYSGGNGFAQGLQTAGLYQQVQGQRAQTENAQAQSAELAQFKKDWQASFGDPQKMSDLVAKYPGQLDAIKQGIGFQDEQHQLALGNAARDLRVALASGNPQAIGAAASRNAGVLGTIGSSPEDILQQYQQDPQSLAQIVDAVGLSALGAKDYYGVQNDRAQRANDQASLAERIRSNQAGEALQARGQDITIRGQDISAATSRRGQDMASERASAKATSNGDGKRVVQLSDGRTVNVGGKLHGAGANAFYEGIDDSGNIIRVPASAIAAPATSAASAQNYAMAKDLEAIENASSENLDFMTGVTGGNGAPALGADVRSRLTGGDQRKLYNATQRIQGRMQNQGIAAARDMGASGINTVAEAKMYFQGMPQLDFSSPEAAQDSVRNIRQYTDQYNQQYNVNVGGRSSQQPSTPVAQPAPQQQAGFSSLWGD